MDRLSGFGPNRKSCGRLQFVGDNTPRSVGLFHRFGRDESGVISILGAFFIVLSLGLCVVVIDVGHLYLAKRRLQSAVDAAALAAAGNPENADAIVRTSLARNGYPDTQLQIEAGTYTADPALPVADRLDPDSGTTPNAVRVTKAVTTPDFFAGLFGEDGVASVAATATAARVPSVSFSVGSGLASVSAGEINHVLGALLGTSLSLSLADYTGLASANVDALAMLDRLASQADLAAGTYGDLANADITLGQFLAAAQAVLNAHPEGQDGAALQALNLLSLQVPPGVSASLGAIVDMSLWQTRKIGSIVEQQPGRTAINLFDVVTAMARIYGASHLADLGTGLSIPVTGSSVSVYLSAGEPMASMTTGVVGATLSTSQVRLALTVTAANVDLGVAKATIRIPVYVQMATGSGTVTAISCRKDDTMATVTATPMSVWAQIGDVDSSKLSDYGSVPAPQQADIVSLTVLGIPVAIQASASDSVAAGPSQALDFRQSDIDAGTVKSAGADTSHLLSDLAGGLDLSVQGAGLNGAVKTIVAGTVMPLLRPVLVSMLSSLDPLIYNLLQTIGLQLGTVSVAVHGVNCGRPTIVG